jgi:NlpC/P60 family putative phage cell wall peptidase
MSIVGVARLWLGTPYVRGAAVRGVGCDCVGLARGVWADVTGAERPPEAPAWRPDWAVAWPRRLMDLGRAHMLVLDPSAASAGDLVALRPASRARPAHVGILSDGGGFIHASEARGVVEVPLSAWAARIVWAARFPAA